MMSGVTRFCSLSNICKIALLEIAFMLAFWVGDYWPPFFGRVKKPCDVTNSSIVRKIVQKNWTPVLSRYGVNLPIECPLNLSRDLLGVRESLKSTRSSHWQCLECGKKFYLERHLDLHIERRHADVINKAEDSVCLGEYCDVMRCDVLMSTSFLDEDSKSTDVSVWTPNALGSSTGKGSYKSGHLHLDHKNQPRPPTANNPPPDTSHNGRGGGGDQSSKKSSSSSSSSSTSSSSSSHHSHGPGEECDEEHFSNLREKCGDLVWECLQGLISVLDAKDFKALQGELESISCSYLSCARYGDACCPSSSRLRGKLRPFFIVFGSLVISLILALAYYFTWIYTQANEDSAYYEDNNLDDKTYSAELTTSNMMRKGVPPPPPPLVNRTSHI